MRRDLEDQLAIRELLARYSWAMDTGDVATLLSVFAEDAIFENPRGRFCGHGELGDLFRALRVTPKRLGMQHWVDNLVVELDPSGEAATGRAYVMTTRLDEQGWVPFRGSYRDRFVKVDGEWKFSARSSGPWSSPVGDPDAVFDDTDTTSA